MHTKLSIDSNIPVSWLPFVRLIWLACAILLIGGFMWGVPFMYAEVGQICMVDCTPYLMTQAEVSLLAEWGYMIKCYQKSHRLYYAKL